MVYEITLTLGGDMFYNEMLNQLSRNSTLVIIFHGDKKYCHDDTKNMGF